MKASEIQDKPVLSIADGAKLGTVSDLLFDTGSRRLAALVLATGGGRSVLPFSSIRSIGADAVTIESSAASQDSEGASRMGNLRGFGDLKGLPVANSDGTHLGDIQEVEIDHENGRLVELVAHRGGVLGLGGKSVKIDSAAVRGFGEKLVTVDLPEQ